jgi:hypothetical protein
MRDIFTRWGWIAVLSVSLYMMGTVRFPDIGNAQRNALDAGSVSSSLKPPKPPRHKRKNITTIEDLAKDLSEVVAYLDKGRVYFKTYQTGSHTVAENADFLNFLETYERELALARKEAKTLQAWIDSKGPLDSVLKQD